MVTAELSNFQCEMTEKEVKLSHNIAKCMASISSTSQVMISSKLAAYTSQPVAFNGRPSTCKCLIGHRIKPSKADLLTLGSGILVIS